MEMFSFLFGFSGRFNPGKFFGAILCLLLLYTALLGVSYGCAFLVERSLLFQESPSLKATSTFFRQTGGFELLLARGDGVDTHRITQLSLQVMFGMSVLSTLLVAWSWLAACTKRLRDLGWPVWLSALSLIPLLGQLVFVVLGIVPGRKESKA